MNTTFKSTARREVSEFGFTFAVAVALLGAAPALAAVRFEAESGVLGAGFALNSGSPAYITATADGSGVSHFPADSLDASDWCI